LFKPNAPPCTGVNAAQERAYVNSENPISAPKRKKVGQTAALKAEYTAFLPDEHQEKQRFNGKQGDGCAKPTGPPRAPGVDVCQDGDPVQE
tara:strand:- start:1 stop:273 length:273 start_codon:yes stop_codon:yes gene_type:complete